MVQAFTAEYDETRLRSRSSANDAIFFLPVSRPAIRIAGGKQRGPKDGRESWQRARGQVMAVLRI